MPKVILLQMSTGLSQSILWEEAAAVGQVPAPRSGHSFSTVGGRHFLFGGAGRHEGDRGIHLLRLEKEIQSVPT